MCGRGKQKQKLGALLFLSMFIWPASGLARDLSPEEKVLVKVHAIYWSLGKCNEVGGLTDERYSAASALVSRVIDEGVSRGVFTRQRSTDLRTMLLEESPIIPEKILNAHRLSKSIFRLSSKMARKSCKSYNRKFEKYIQEFVK